MANNPINEIAIKHPIIKTAAGKIFWNEPVTKVRRKGEKSNYIFVVANTGLYLFRKRSFPAGLKIVRYIALNMLKSLSITSNSIIFFFKKKNINIIHEKFVELGHFVNSLIFTLFGNLDISIDSTRQLEFDRCTKKFESKSPLADRFIALSAKIIAHQYLDLAQDMYTSLERSPTSISITPSIVASVFINTLVEAVSLDKQLHHLKLKNLTMGSFCPFLSTIFNRNESIDSLSLIDFSFAGYSNDSEYLFSEKCIVQLKSLRFIRCELNRPEFTLFVNEFATYKANIATLHLDSCIFNEQTIDSLFVSFFDADCFANLENFSLIGADMPERIQILYVQLLGSNWIIKHQTLKAISAKNTGIDAVFMIPILSLLENKITTINFSGCKFTEPIDHSNNYFSHLSEIDLSSCSFTCESLISLFTAIEACNSQPSSLFLDSINFQDFHNFLKKAVSIKKIGLQSFSFNGNLVDPADYEMLFKFLKNMKSLKNLSISNTLLASVKKAPSYIVDLIKSLSLEAIVIRGSQQYEFCQNSFDPVLEAIVSKKKFVTVDITGHRIGDKGIKILIKLLSQKQLRDLCFDNTGFSDLKQYLEFLEEIVLSDLESAQFPQQDIDILSNVIKNGQNSDLLERLARVKKDFVQRFGIFSEQKAMDEYNSHLDRSGSSARSRAESCVVYNIESSVDATDSRLISGDNFDEGFNVESTKVLLSLKEDMVQKAVAECMGDNSNLPENDVLVKSFKFLLEASSIDRLVVQQE